MFRITVLDFFSSIYDFEPYVLGLGRIFLIFVFENALYVTTRSVKRWFFFRKNHTPFIILKFRAKTSIIWFRLFNRTVRVVFYVSKWTLRLKNFSKKKFFILFSGLSLENVRILSVSFRQLSQNCIYVSKGTFWGKQVISEKDVFFRDFNWRILDLQWSFSAGLSKRHSKCPEVSFERFIIGKIFQVNFTFLENSVVGFSELNLACPAYYFEKNCLLFWKLKTLLFSFSFGAKKICHISKRHRKAPIETALNCPDKSFAEMSGQKVLRFLSEIESETC